MRARLAVVSLCALGVLTAAACDEGAAAVSPDGSESAVDAPPGAGPDAVADGPSPPPPDGRPETPDAAIGEPDAGVEPPDAAPPRLTCNGAEALCARRYDEVAYVTTHNAMSSQEDGFFGPNQYYGIARQLDDGVRGLMLDVHDDGGRPFLCHGNCLLGKKPLVDGLGLIRAFLDAHPREVVTIIFESYVDGGVIDTAFAAADVVRYVHTQRADQPWPTLAAMIEANRRLVVLTDRPGGPAWNMDVWAHSWETHYSARTTADFSCNPNRGNTRNRLFIFNHFLTNILPVPGQAGTTNGNPLLGNRVADCRRVSGDFPNFVTVDFYSVGVVREVVAQLNGVD